jgi:hypothetical protein
VAVLPFLKVIILGAVEQKCNILAEQITKQLEFQYICVTWEGLDF